MRRSLLLLIGVLLTTALEVRSQDRVADKNKMNLPEKKPVESWYKIVLGEEHIGYAYEWIRRSEKQQEYAYDYAYRMQVELRVPGETSAIFALNLKDVRLNSAFLPERMTAITQIGAVTIETNLTTTASARTLTQKIPGGDVITYNIREGEDVHFLFPLMTYWLRHNDYLSKDKTEWKAFFFAPSAVKSEPNVQEGAVEVLSDEPKKKVLDKEAFATRIRIKHYPGADKSLLFSEAFVDKYGRTVELTSADGLKLFLVADEQKALGDLKTILAGDRQDPFRKDLAMHKKGSKTEPITKKDNLGITDKNLAEKVAEAEKKLDDALKPPGPADPARLYQELLASYTVFLKIQQGQSKPDLAVKAKIEAFKAKLEKHLGGAKRALEEARKLKTDALSIDALSYDLKGMEDKVAKIKEIKARPEFNGTGVEKGYLLELDNFLTEIDEVKQKVKARLELDGKRIALNGTLTATEDVPETIDIDLALVGHSMHVKVEIPFVRSNTLASIYIGASEDKEKISKESKYYRVGDKIGGEGPEVTLIEIQKFGIKVEYKGQVRDIPLK